MSVNTIPPAIVDRLRSARRFAVLTGAGVSAESGIDTFRGADGSWSKVNIEEVATPQGFARDPRKVWAWYNERRINIAASHPNPAHHALARLERHAGQFTLVTQNIDGLHRVAGSLNVIEIHGNIWTVIDTVTGEYAEHREVPLRELPPHNAAGHLLRPAVVWFGESLPQGALETGIAAARACDVCLVVGTSAVVFPAASIPLYAKQAGALLLEFNLEPTELSDIADHVFLGKAGEHLPRLLEEMGIGE